MKYIVPKEIPVDFHNESNNDYHFIIKVLAKEFGVEFNCLGENIGVIQNPFNSNNESN